MTKHDLACEINDNGRWEEFHQKRGNHYMFDYHKSRRLMLERKYRAEYLKEPTKKTRTIN